MDRSTLSRVLVALAGNAGRYFALWVVLGTLAGSIRPGLVAWVGPHIPFLLGVIMFGMGMTLSGADFKAALRRPRDVAVGVLAQYTIMPLVAYGLAVAMSLPPELAVGVVLVGTCPGGTASNVVTYLARGDLALSVSMTSIATLVAPVLTPLLTWWLAGQWIPVSAGALFLSIVKIVLLPVAAGVLAHRFAARAVARITPVLPLVSVSAIVLIVAFVVSANLERLLATAGTLFVVVALHNLIGLGAGYSIARALGMDDGKKRAVAIEVGMQNSGLAVSLAAVHFNPAAAIPGALFSVWHNLSGPALATYWAARPPIKRTEAESAAASEARASDAR